MAKRHPNLFHWQWHGYADFHCNPTNLALHVIAVPLFIISAVILLYGLFDLSLSGILLGVIGIVASLAIQKRGHGLEEREPIPFSGRKDAITRLLAEQFVTFPRFLLSGAWWRAWRKKHR